MIILIKYLTFSCILRALSKQNFYLELNWLERKKSSYFLINLNFLNLYIKKKLILYKRTLTNVIINYFTIHGTFPFSQIWPTTSNYCNMEWKLLQTFEKLYNNFILLLNTINNVTKSFVVIYVCVMMFCIKILQFYVTCYGQIITLLGILNFDLNNNVCKKNFLFLFHNLICKTVHF